MSRPVALVAGLLAAALLLTACGVPRERAAQDLKPAKTAITLAEVARVVDRYREVRSAAVDSLDAKPLSTVESSAVLAIDTGMFEVAEKLDREEFALDGPYSIETTYVPRFTRYPLWFVVVLRDKQTDRRQAQVYERLTAADPWLLAATPELTADTVLPPTRDVGEVTRRVGADHDEGMPTSPREALAALAAALEDPDAAEAKFWREDPFVEQMREIAARNTELDGASFAQGWGVDDQLFALRAADGGALVFGTLLRQDSFEVEEGLRVTWPEDTPQRAFWPDGVVGAGSLRYYHQVLLRIPPAGQEAAPHTLGSFGGVVGSAGQ